MTGPARGKWTLVNVTKCAIMSLTTRKPVQVYTMDNQPIPRAQKHDYHGVTMSANLSLNGRTNTTRCATRLSRHGLVKRTLHAADISVHKTAYIRCSFDHPWTRSTQSALGHHTHRKMPNVWRRFSELLPDLGVATTRRH